MQQEHHLDGQVRYREEAQAAQLAEHHGPERCAAAVPAGHLIATVASGSNVCPSSSRRAASAPASSSARTASVLPMKAALLCSKGGPADAELQRGAREAEKGQRMAG